jgi:5-methylthioadenosine/S-adenosylhomocysteine deaminase
MMDILVTNGTLVTVDADRRIVPDGAVGIVGDTIVFVGAAADGPRPEQARQVVDAQGGIIMPGLVDAHGHAGHGLLKTIASDTPSLWGKIVTDVYYNHTDAEYWLVEGRLSALERLMFGVTTGLSVIASEPRSDDPDLAGAHAAAYAEAGLRLTIAVGPCNPPFPRHASRWTDGKRWPAPYTFQDAMEGTGAVLRRWRGAAGGRIDVMVTPFLIVPSCDSSGPMPADKAHLTDHDLLQSRSVRALARDHGARIHSDAFGGMVRLAAMDPNGLLGPDVLVQHCTGLGLDEVRIIADTGTHVGHAPLSGSLVKARCPVAELLTLGANVAITTDGTAPRTTFDLLPGLRVAARLQQIHHGDIALLPAGKLIEMVTIDAARALGREREIGSLEVGKKADVITLGGGIAPHLHPLRMPVHRIAYEAAGQDVDNVVANGVALLLDRKPQQIDATAIQTAAEAMSALVIERAGLVPHMERPRGFWGSARADHAGERTEARQP